MSIQTRRPYGAFPKIPPHKAAGEYLRSKAAQNIPKYTFDLDDPSLAKVRAQRDDHDTQQRLSKAKRKLTRDHHDRQWAKLEETGNTLRSNMLEFQIFIEQNKGKRMRKQAEVAQFQQMQRKYDDRIESLKSSTDFIKSIKSKMEEKIASHSFYEDFVEAAARQSVEFSSADDVVKRYDILRDSRRAIYENQMSLRGRFYQSFLAINTYVKEAGATQLGLRNEVDKLMNRYEVAKAKSLAWENVLSAVQAEMHRRWGEMTMVKTSCRNVYLDICTRRSLKPVKEDDFRAQLQRIKEELRSMRMTLKRN